MTTKQLLSSNSYMQYPKFLGFYIGVNEAVMLSALCDKDSWCEYNITNYDGYFYYLRDEIELDTGLSESQQRTALKSLSDLHIISTKRAGIPSKVYYKIDIDILENTLSLAYDEYKAHKLQWSQNMTTCDAKNMTTCGSENRTSTIDNNINIKINNKSTGSGALPKNRSFRNHQEKLTDELQSGEVIDEQKKVKKKLSEEDKADKKIDKTSYSDNVKDLLKQFFRQSFYSQDVKRMRSASDLTGKLMRLDELVRKGEDATKVIQQSIDNNWNAFYEYKEKQINSRAREGNQQNVVMSDPEEARRIVQEAIDNGEEFF